jgi:hypothetical protein
MWFNTVHALIVVSILLLILIKHEFSLVNYVFVLVILCTQLFLVRTSYACRMEQFEDGVSKFRKVDTDSMSKLYGLPLQIKTHISGGIQTLIDNMKANNPVSLIQSSDAQYSDERVRKQYKYVNYMLEKIKLFDAKIYSEIVS